MRFVSVCLTMTLWVGCLLVSANDLRNPALKPDKNSRLEGWKILDAKNPYRFDNGVLQGTCKSPTGHAFGFYQSIKYDKPNMDPIVFGGWSRAENAGYGGSYCLYLDLRYADGTPQWKIVKKWTPGTHDWEWIESSYMPRKPVAEIKYYVILRGARGTVWFRDMLLRRGNPGILFNYASVLSMAPWKPDRYCVRFAFYSDNVKSECRFLDAKGRILEKFQAEGKTVRREVTCPEKPAAFEIKASAGGAEKRYRGKIFHAPVPNHLGNGAKYRLWVADSMDKITPLTFPGKQAKQYAKVSLAGNERESFQLQVSNVSETSLNNLSLRITPLKNQAGDSFPGSVEWERIAYLPRTVPYASHPGQVPELQYWLPDPLLPAAPFSVPSNATQGIWLTVHAPGQCPPGKYKGRIEVASEDGILGNSLLEVNIFAFSLPDTFRFRSSFSLQDGWLRNYYPENLKRIRRICWDIMLDHRLNPDDITRTELPDIQDLLYARSRGMNSFNILHLVPKPGKPTWWTLYAPVGAYNETLFAELRKRLDPYMLELRKHDLDKLGYCYGFDERREDFYPAMAKTRKFLHDNYRLPLLSTSTMFMDLAKSPEKKEYLECDWYCPMPQYYEGHEALAESLRKKGHKVWWYTCCGPTYPYMNFSNLEYPFCEARLIAWQTWMQRMDGFLFWHVNYWQQKRLTYLDEAQTYQEHYRSASIAEATGDGELLYPGRKAPVPSIRLANLRDGSEDYDYLSLLGELDRNAARQAAKQIVPKLREFNRNPETIRKIRGRLAAQMEKIKK